MMNGSTLLPRTTLACVARLWHPLSVYGESHTYGRNAPQREHSIEYSRLNRHHFAMNLRYADEVLDETQHSSEKRLHP